MSPAGWWQRYLKWRLRHVIAISCDDLGFTVGEVSVAWNAISRVTAYKRDQLATDLLCLLIESDVLTVEVNEEMVGYAGFEARLGDALGLTPDWKIHVLFPAFATNITGIFERQPA